MELNIPFRLSLCFALFVILYCWNMIFVFFLNGIGKVRFQLYTSLVGSALFIPMSYFFATFCHLGIVGVAVSSLTLAIPSAIWLPLQFKMIMSKTATGIWAK